MSGLGRVLGPCALLYGFEHHRAQQEHADEVGESHQRVEGVGKNPDQIELGQSADGHDDGVEDTDGFADEYYRLQDLAGVLTEEEASEIQKAA